MPHGRQVLGVGDLQLAPGVNPRQKGQAVRAGGGVSLEAVICRLN